MPSWANCLSKRRAARSAGCSRGVRCRDARLAPARVFVIVSNGMIALVDYGMGNLRSVEKALARVGADVRIVSDAKSVLAADAVVLPGVGAFGDCMANLEKAGLTGAIRDFIGTKRPFLGICLGFQALFETSEEAAGVRGLAVFPGRVPRVAANGLKVPHMGWDELR